MPGRKTGTTRRGTSFRSTRANTEKREVMTATGELAEMLKTLLTGRKTLEEALRKTTASRRVSQERHRDGKTNGPTTWTRGRNTWRGRR